MMRIILLAFPMSLVWMILVQNITPQGFIVGYIFGLGVLILVRMNVRIKRDPQRLNLIKLPGRLVALGWYIVRLSWDILVSGADVAWRVIQPEMPIDPGLQKLDTQDESANPFIAALTAHSITITPGEMVVDFEDDRTMIVHSLDVGASTHEKLEDEQTTRMRLFKRIFGDV